MRETAPSSSRSQLGFGLLVLLLLIQVVTPFGIVASSTRVAARNGVITFDRYSSGRAAGAFVASQTRYCGALRATADGGGDTPVDPTAAAPSSSSEKEAEAAANEQDEQTPVSQVSLPPGVSLEEPTEPQPPRLDPLVQSLTRMDAETAQAPTMKVPLWGELILDRSLFVLVPIAAFGIIGVVFSIYVLINSGDALVDALTEGGGANTVSTPTPPAAGSVVDPNVCRGICSQQEQDYESLKVFMNSLAGKQPPQ